MGGGDEAVSAASDTTSADGVKVNVNIRCSNGSKFSVLVSLDSTVGSFKSILADQSEVPADQQRLIYKGRILKDDQTLQSYGAFLLHSFWVFRIEFWMVTNLGSHSFTFYFSDFVVVGIEFFNLLFLCVI